MGKIVVIGSLNMDHVIDVEQLPASGETVLSKRVSLVCGGKGGNQAVTCATLGSETIMLGAVGMDHNGDELLKSLSDAGVDISRIKRCCEKPTGTAFIPVAASGENSIIVAQGANAMVTRNYIEEHIEAIKEADAVILQLEIPMDTVCYAAEVAKALCKLVILDPAPAVTQMPERLIKCIDILKPNESELHVLTGLPVRDEADAEIASSLLVKRGVKEVIVTLGDKGALLCVDDNLQWFQALRVEPVDTTAAGDSFAAALAYMLIKGHSTQEAIRFAMEIASVVVTRKGAIDSIPSKEEALKIYKKHSGIH